MVYFQCNPRVDKHCTMYESSLLRLSLLAYVAKLDGSVLSYVFYWLAVIAALVYMKFKEVRVVARHLFCFLSVIFRDVLLSLGKSPRRVPAVASEKRRQTLARTWLSMNQKRSCVSWKYNVFETSQLPRVRYHHRPLVVLCFWTSSKNLWQFLYSVKHL